MRHLLTATGRVLGLAVFILWPVLGQDAVYPPPKPTPPKIGPQAVVLSESIIQTQWSHTLDLVNAPATITEMNPGQCVRIGVYANGDDRDAYLGKTKIGFRVRAAGHTDERPVAPLYGTK